MGRCIESMVAVNPLAPNGDKIDATAKIRSFLFHCNTARRGATFTVAPVS